MFRLRKGCPLKKTLILLTLNEIEGITALHDQIPFDAANEVLIVDGGSTDGTLLSGGVSDAATDGWLVSSTGSGGS